LNKILLENFEKDIQDIQEYIKHIDLINIVTRKDDVLEDEALNNLITHLHTFGTEKRLFEYKAIIISLYGILEKYISIWIKEYIDSLSNLIINYNNLPTELKESHFKLSIKLISTINENRYVKYNHLTKEDVLIKLSSCINQPLEYILNTDAFLPISGNLKHSKIVEAFEPLDIKLNKRLMEVDSFSAYLKTKYGEGIASRKAEYLYKTIDDLVMLRNEIAHGSFIDNIISNFDEYIDFLKYYGQAIFEILIQKKIEYESIHLYQRIQKIVNIFKDKESGLQSILAFEIENNKVKVGNFLIIKDKDTFFKKEILGIQLDEKPFKELEIEEKTKIAVNIGFSIKKSQTFFIEEIFLAK